MAKEQKTMMVPPDVYRFFEERSRMFGGTFTQHASAAFLQYFLSDLRGPDPFWMQLAFDLDKNLSLSDALRRIAERMDDQLTALASQDRDQRWAAMQRVGPRSLADRRATAFLFRKIADKADQEKSSAVDGIVDGWHQHGRVGPDGETALGLFDLPKAADAEGNE